MRRVMFVCTANSARSVLAEAILRHRGGRRFEAYSSGSSPRGTVNPDALLCLARHGLPTTGYRSKSWDEFASEKAPVLDLVVTVCDSAAGESCPVWLGHPMTVHWGIPDPASVDGDEAVRAAAFDLAFLRLSKRISAFLDEGDDVFDAPDGRDRLNAIGKLDLQPEPSE
ncbi:ArsR family transcriptional regulator [Roseibium aquae]|uniref:ArsR family transcriptional regulator n=1 Tax=Roseibium aquae TaxID=1323746 RepID=A0A916T627_9HYPH|nr:arsenate reductase ArsC [Roseibium aquae]GGB33207.1 ArsR family transcriptional regulator [Roseibium aquae]